MNRNQIITIESLTSRMLMACLPGARDHMVFTVEPLNSGYMVCGVTDADSVEWYQRHFQALAYVGPRGGVKSYKEFC